MASRFETDIQKLDSTVILGVDGRIDSTTADDFERIIIDNISGISTFIVDLAKTEYISSACLRVLISTHKKMTAAGGKLCIRNASDEVKDVFEVTGLGTILNVE